MIARAAGYLPEIPRSCAVLSQLLAGRRDVDRRVTRDPRSSSSFDDFSPVLRHPSESGRSAPAVSVLRASYSPSLPARAHPRSLTHTRCSLSAQLSASRGSGLRGWRGGQALERRPTTSSSSPARAQRAPASPPASPPPRAASPRVRSVWPTAPVGPQIVFAFPRSYAAGLLAPRPGGGRFGGGLAVAWGGAIAIGDPSRACRRGAACVLERQRARWRARWRLVAAEDAPCGRVRRARVRPDCTHPDGGRRVECQCVRVSCARSCVCRVYMYCMRA